MYRKQTGCLISVLILLAWVSVARTQTVSDEAQRYMSRGMTAVEMAKSPKDYERAVLEFEQAAKLAPDWPDVYFNLGAVQTKAKNFSEAIRHYKRYLELAPNAPDAAKVREEIFKLEYRAEQATKANSRAGVWLTEEGTPYRLLVDDNRIRLATNQHYVTNAEVESTYPVVGSVPITTPTQITYKLELQGNQVTGTWNRAAFKADKCTVPEESGKVAGEIYDAEQKLVLRYIRTKYRASTQMSLLSDDYCRGVAVVEKKEIEKSFYGPLPRGGLGVALGGVTSYWAGGLSPVKYGWSGHLVIAGLSKDSPAFAAGLREGDEILAISGVEVKSLSARDAIRRLRGEVGSELELSVIHKRSAKPVTLLLRRVAIPDDNSLLN